MISGGSKTNKIGYKTVVVGIASASIEFVESLRSYLETWKISGHIHTCKTWWSFTLKCGQAMAFLSLIYSDSEGMRLDRKYRVYKRALDMGLSYKPSRKPKRVPGQTVSA